MALSFFVWFWDAIYRDRWKVEQQCWIRFHSFTNIVGATHAHNTMHCRSQHCWELIVASVCTPLPTRMQQLPTLLAAQFCELMRPFARSLRTVASYHSKINNLAMFILNRITFAPAQKPYPHTGKGLYSHITEQWFRRDFCYGNGAKRHRTDLESGASHRKGFGPHFGVVWTSSWTTTEVNK